MPSARSALVATVLATLVAAAPASAASRFTKPVTAFTTKGDISFIVATGSPEGGAAFSTGYTPARGGNILYYTRVRPDGRVDGVTEHQVKSAFGFMGDVITGVRVARGWRFFRTDLAGSEPRRFDLIEIAKNGKVRNRTRLPGTTDPNMWFNGRGRMILETEKRTTLTDGTGRPRKIASLPDLDTVAGVSVFEDGRAYASYEYARADESRLHVSRLSTRTGRWTKPQELFHSPGDAEAKLENSSQYSNKPGETLIRYTVDPTPDETGGFQRFVRWSTRGGAFGPASELLPAGQVPTAGGALRGDGYLFGDVTEDGTLHALYSPGAGKAFTDRWRYPVAGGASGSVTSTLMKDGRTALSWATRAGETTSIHSVVVSATGKAGDVQTLATLPERTRLVDREQTLLGSGTVVIAWNEARYGPDEAGGDRGPLIDSRVKISALRP